MREVGGTAGDDCATFVCDGRYLWHDVGIWMYGRAGLSFGDSIGRCLGMLGPPAVYALSGAVLTFSPSKWSAEHHPLIRMREAGDALIDAGCAEPACDTCSVWYTDNVQIYGVVCEASPCHPHARSRRGIAKLLCCLGLPYSLSLAWRWRSKVQDARRQLRLVIGMREACAVGRCDSAALRVSSASESALCILSHW